VRALLLLIGLGALATPAGAQSHEVLGYAGVLGEWEVTATVRETAPARSKKFSGPLTMKHVGLCTQDGPEEKTGELRLWMSAAPYRLHATLSVAGEDCTYSASLSDAYTGMLLCPGKGPVPLILWVK
jgi:hypothetical protein